MTATISFFLKPRDPSKLNLNHSMIASLSRKIRTLEPGVECLLTGGYKLNQIDPLITSAAEVKCTKRNTKEVIVESNTKTRGAASHSKSKQISKAAARRITIKSANASCTDKDPHTGRVCGSRYQMEIDHIIPKALGGGDEPENLRILCRKHNLYAAERVFGKKHMDRFRKG